MVSHGDDTGGGIGRQDVPDAAVAKGHHLLMVQLPVVNPPLVKNSDGGVTQAPGPVGHHGDRDIEKENWH